MYWYLFLAKLGILVFVEKHYLENHKELVWTRMFMLMLVIRQECC
jgi:hypothetical protein